MVQEVVSDLEGNISTGRASPGSTPNSSSSLIGATTAGGRSLVYQMTSFYLRTPLKLFRPARFDYLHYLRVLLVGDDKTRTPKHEQPNTAHFTLKSHVWSPRYLYYLENTSLGILTKGLNKYGWRVIPERVLPPLIANSAAGVLLYTTYLTTLNAFAQSNPNNSSGYHRPWDVVRAGFIAGAAQALASAPIDAIYTRSTVDQLLTQAKNYDNLWVYSFRKLQEIGLVGCFGGFGLSLLKECFGFATYFTVFEFLKGQVCQWTIDSITSYRELKLQLQQSKLARMFQDDSEDEQNLQPANVMSAKEQKRFHQAFVFVGGVSAAFLLQVIQYPFLKLQKIHLSRLEAFDIYMKATSNQSGSQPYQRSPRLNEGITRIRIKPGNQRLFHIYYHSYLDTFQHVYFIQKSTGAICKWLYKGFCRNTLAIIPGTTAGLLCLELMRNKLGDFSSEHALESH
ncbi:LAME_0E12112g1_1 [Lachancea meyersii CBS 8951]|uniref:LAME_0E12112g1_1 n=1 Tax=Lachancea meyersii CBS 8951 TaxID=1266667 RepID=A0A1G4JLF9_9SACH|nr:LAME_0E12112g1_1 [Lachancea meyersii CBS 8951]